MKKYILLLQFTLMVSILQAQNFTDGLMMPKKDFCTGVLIAQDTWKNYWEGSLNRTSGNIGTITTNNIAWMGSYGITNKINAIAMLPYVATNASQGVLSGMQGIQDLTLAAKFNIYKKAVGTSTFNSFVLGSYSTPISDYTPDFLPLSIGLGTQKLSSRLTNYFQMTNGFYSTATIAYTWRSNVKLDRPAYFADNQLILSNEVWMPNILDYSISVGYLKNELNVFCSYTQQNTLGGDNIRRQDMPFVSNKMNFSKVDVTVMYYLPQLKNLAVRGLLGYTVAGLNVGQSTYYMGGLLYTFHFAKTDK